MPIPNEFTIEKEHHGLRLDVFLAQQITDYSRSMIQKWIQDGMVFVNGKPVKPREKLELGQTVTLNLDLLKPRSDLETLTPQNIPLEIIYEDADLMVVNKPSGMVVHPGAGVYDNTLVNALLFHDEKLITLPRAGIIHRLDKETTGLLIVGKTQAAYQYLTKAMKDRDIERRYLALVYGELVSQGEIHTFLGRSTKNRLKIAVTQSGREAVTHYFIQKKWDGLTLVELKLLTGRTHQIRVHMSHINHPVVGDPLYGGTARLPKGYDDDILETFKAFKRQALHAYTLKFLHPITQKELTLKAPLPQDFSHLLTVLDPTLELP